MSEQLYVNVKNGGVTGYPLTHSNLKKIHNKEFNNNFLKTEGFARAFIEKPENIAPWEILVEGEWSISPDMLSAKLVYSKQTMNSADVDEDLLQSFKSHLLSDLNAVRYIKEISGYEDVNGNKIDTSRESQQKIITAKIAVSDGSLVEPILWKTLGGSWVEFSASEFNNLFAAITQNTQNIFKAQKAAESIINNYTTLEEIISCDVNILFDNAFSNV